MIFSGQKFLDGISDLLVFGRALRKPQKRSDALPCLPPAEADFLALVSGELVHVAWGRDHHYLLRSDWN
jgi:hypothetical protein